MGYLTDSTHFVFVFFSVYFSWTENPMQSYANRSVLYSVKHWVRSFSYFFLLSICSVSLRSFSTVFFFFLRYHYKYDSGSFILITWLYSLSAARCKRCTNFANSTKLCGIIQSIVDNYAQFLPGWYSRRINTTNTCDAIYSFFMMSNLRGICSSLSATKTTTTLLLKSNLNSLRKIVIDLRTECTHTISWY